MSDINIEKPDQPEVLVELKTTHPFFTDMGVVKCGWHFLFCSEGQTLVLL